jgi:SPW repeat
MPWNRVAPTSAALALGAVSTAKSEKENVMHSDVRQATVTNGMATQDRNLYLAEYTMPPSTKAITAQVSSALAVLAGLWVAISPWFLVLQHGPGSSATAGDLIVGLAVAAVAMFAASGARGFMGLQLGNLALGAWLIVSPFILAAKFAIAAPMYWSNIWAGAVVMVLALAALGSVRRLAAR